MRNIIIHFSIITRDYTLSMFTTTVFFPYFQKEERAVKIGVVEFTDQFVQMTEACSRVNVC